MKILLTHVSYHCSVGVIKLLKTIQKKKISIIGCSSYELGLSSGSLLVDKFYCAPTIDHSEEYLNFIRKLVVTEKIDFIISPDETELLLFEKNKEFFKGKIVIPMAETIRLFQDKQKASEAMALLGILIPNIISYQTLLKGLTKEKIIIRENISCCSYGIHITTGSNLSDIQNHYTANSFIQEFISGKEYTVDVFCDKQGSPQIIIPRERLAIRNGITYKCQIVKELKLIEICQKIYKNYYLPGFSNVQFIIKNQKPYFIELNPRLGGTTIASSLACVNLVELFIDHFVDDKGLLGLEYYMQKVKWGAIITRYYEETIFWEPEGRNL